MTEAPLFWLGMAGLIVGIMVGVSMLEGPGDASLRSIMFAGGIACATFLYLGIQAEKDTWSPLYLWAAFPIGGAAAMFVALVAKGNLRAAFVAGGVAAMALQLMVRLIPPGSLGIPVPHDLAMAIDLAVAGAAGSGCYYVLRRWGRDEDRWD